MKKKYPSTRTKCKTAYERELFTCPVCGEQLGGEGSVAEPYYCSCGIWVSSREKIGYEILRGNSADCVETKSEEVLINKIVENNMTKKYTIWVVIDKNKDFEIEQIFYCYDKGDAKMTAELWNDAEKNKPYKVKKAYLILA